MTIHVSKLMDTALLDEMVQGGYIRVQTHPTKPLSVFNYTEKAQWERVWNPATRQSRGLILDRDWYVVARPFPKFFNHGEAEAPELEEGPIRVYDKLDGSLGILYSWKGEWAVATRGSFTSDQALWATDWFRECGWKPSGDADDFTWLFEIIYPNNRIVIDYAGKEALVLLDVLNNHTGQPALQLQEDWPGERVEQYYYTSVMDVLAAEPRPNREGFVIYHENTGHRVKVKYDEYVRLHRLVTGVTARTIWELLESGKTLDELLANVPDEFYDWVQQTARDLELQYITLISDAESEYTMVEDETARVLSDELHEVDDRFARKTFALAAQRLKVQHMSALFLLLDDNRDKLSDWAWRQVKPAADRPYNTTLMEEVSG